MKEDNTEIAENMMERGYVGAMGNIDLGAVEEGCCHETCRYHLDLAPDWPPDFI